MLIIVFHCYSHFCFILLTPASGNHISAAAWAFLVNCIVAHENLTTFDIDCEACAVNLRLRRVTPLLFAGAPAEASSCGEWSQLRLPRVDPGVLRGGWTDTLSFVREFLLDDNVAVFDMRLMVIGASEVSAIVCVRSPSE